LHSVLDQASVDVAERPIIVALSSEGAEITIVVGDPTGTTLVYFPVDYAQNGVGSLMSVADREAASADHSEPPLVPGRRARHLDRRADDSGERVTGGGAEDGDETTITRGNDGTRAGRQPAAPCSLTRHGRQPAAPCSLTRHG